MKILLVDVGQSTMLRKTQLQRTNYDKDPHSPTVFRLYFPGLHSGHLNQFIIIQAQHWTHSMGIEFVSIIAQDYYRTVYTTIHNTHYFMYKITYPRFVIEIKFVNNKTNLSSQKIYYSNMYFLHS